MSFMRSMSSKLRDHSRDVHVTDDQVTRRDSVEIVNSK